MGEIDGICKLHGTLLFNGVCEICSKIEQGEELLEELEG